MASLPMKRSLDAVSDTAPHGEAARRVESDEPYYIERNRLAWESWAPDHAAAARRAWEDEELRWGIWGIPETELHLLDGLPAGAVVVELGCGTAVVCAGLARRGLQPVGVDIARPMLEAAAELERDFGLWFPLLCANAERLHYDDEAFDCAISDYGASLWCHPRRWLAEAYRILRVGGRLIFITNSAFLLACTPEDGGPAREELVRDYFGSRVIEFPEDGTVEFHPAHGDWIRLLHGSGFVVEDIIEPQPIGDDVRPRFDFTSAPWALRWPSEDIWVARKVR